MKAKEFKQIIKESVREVIQEELKEILLEAVRSPKQPIKESFTPNNSQIQSPTPNQISQPSVDLRSKYMGALGETAMSFSSQDAVPFRPPSDTVNGNLGTGEVGLDQISSLLNSK